MSIESVMLSSHLILCCSLLLLSPIPPSNRIFSNESALRKRWPKYWSFSFSIIPSNEHQDWSPSEWTGWISLQSKGLSRVFFDTTVQKHKFLGTQLSSQSNSHIHTWLVADSSLTCHIHMHIAGLSHKFHGRTKSQMQKTKKRKQSSNITRTHSFLVVFCNGRSFFCP